MDKVKPFTQFNHPLKYKTDKGLSIIFKRVFPLDALCNVNITTQPSPLLLLIRKRIERLDNFLYHLSIILWNYKRSNVDDYLIGGTVHISRQPNILNQWNLIVAEKVGNHASKQDINNLKKSEDDGHTIAVPGNFKKDESLIDIEITCLASSVANLKQHSQSLSLKQKHKKSFGYQHIFSFERLDQIEFQPNCPIIIYFHGGGMVLGSNRDGFFFQNYVSNLANISKKKEKKQQEQSVIVLSANYRLAPEHPFPNQVIDCLSVSSFIIEHYSDHDIHIAGFSAGGNLATVVGMECHRKYPGRVKSIVPLDPVLLPYTDTSSFHLNSDSATICPAKFVRWSWANYLQPEAHNSEINTDFGSIEEYKLLLENSPWFESSRANQLKKKDFESDNHDHQSHPLTRLFWPNIDLPRSLNKDEAPIIIVKTSSADTLRDDGLDLVQSLKDVGANVVHFETIGSHGISALIDKKTCKMLTDFWRKIIWGE